VIELFHNDMSVCSAKVRIVLAEKGLGWKSHTLNLRAGDAQRPEYLRLNPNAVVPTLVHDAKVVVESAVICEYLDDVWAETPLRPGNPLARARMRLWTKQLDEGVHAATGTVSACIAFRHQHMKKSAEDLKRYIDGIPQPERRERIQKAVEFGMDSPTFAPALRRLDRLIADIERALTDSDWLAGESYCLADAAYTPYMIRLEHLGLGDMIKPRPRIADWTARLFARPSFKTAVADWFNPETLAVFEAHRESAREKAARILKA